MSTLLEKIAKRSALSEVPSCGGWLRYDGVTPALSFRYFVREAGDQLKYLVVATETSKPSWPRDEQLVGVLQFFSGTPAANGPCEISPLHVEGLDFDAFCVVEPSIGQALKFELGADAARVIKGFPIFRCELGGDERADVLRETLKVGRLSVDWAREPRPVVDLWIKNPGAGWRSYAKQPRRVTFSELRALIGACFAKPDTSWKLRNFRGDVAEFRGTTTGATTQGAVLFVELDALLAQTWSFLTL